MPDDVRLPTGDAPQRTVHGNAAPGPSTCDPTAADEPVDLVAVQADDELINALAAGCRCAAPGRGGYDADDQVAALLAAWRPRSTPSRSPSWSTSTTAVAAVRSGMPPAKPTRPPGPAPRPGRRGRGVRRAGRRRRRRSAPHTAEPDGALWPVSKVLFSERAESVEAAVRVEEQSTRPSRRSSQGKPEQAAAQELAQARAATWPTVRPQEGEVELADVQELPGRQGGRDAAGHAVDPASPLETRPSGPSDPGAGAGAVDSSPPPPGIRHPGPDQRRRRRSTRPPRAAERPTPRPSRTAPGAVGHQGARRPRRAHGTGRRWARRPPRCPATGHAGRRAGHRGRTTQRRTGMGSATAGPPSERRRPVDATESAAARPRADAVGRVRSRRAPRRRSRGSTPT